MQIIIEEIATGHKMFASLHNMDKKEAKSFIQFYNSCKVGGVKKYRVIKSM